MSICFERENVIECVWRDIELWHHEEAWEMEPNENKMSDGGRDRSLLGVDVWKSSQILSVQRSAVRSIAWLGLDVASHSAMKTSELPMTNDVEANGNPRGNAQRNGRARRMQCAGTVN